MQFTAVFGKGCFRSFACFILIFLGPPPAEKEINLILSPKKAYNICEYNIFSCYVPVLLQTLFNDFYGLCSFVNFIVDKQVLSNISEPVQKATQAPLTAYSSQSTRNKFCVQD